MEACTGECMEMCSTFNLWKRCSIGSKAVEAGNIPPSTLMNDEQFLFLQCYANEMKFYGLSKSKLGKQNNSLYSYQGWCVLDFMYIFFIVYAKLNGKRCWS